MRWLKEKVNMFILSLALLILAFIAIFFSLRATGRVYTYMQDQLRAESSRRQCEEQSQALADASDYLTAEVWNYIATGDQVHMGNYWYEVDHGRRRDQAIDALYQLELTEEEAALVQAAKAESDQLIKGEAWAMRMAAESRGMNSAEMPARVAGTALSPEQERLSPAEKKEQAVEYIFGSLYMDSKNKIRDSLSRFDRLLNERKAAQLSEAEARTERAMMQAQGFYVIVLALLIITLSAFYGLVLRPFHQYSRALEGMNGQAAPLRPYGSAETRNFARVFNQLYAKWQEQNEHLKALNAVDGLTGIPNRQTLYGYLETCIAGGGENIGVIMMDIDSFKSFNDTYGHLAGDKALVKVSECLAEAVPEGEGIVSRLSGEEFVIVLPGTDEERMRAVSGLVMENIRNSNLKHEILYSVDTYVTVSMGGILWNREEPLGPQDLIHQADLALYQAKKNGKNQYIMFTEDDYTFKVLQDIRTHDSEVEADMHRAAKAGEFIPYLQPKVDLNTGEIAGAEALVRWKHPQKGILFPDYFVPVFERNGFIREADYALFQSVCAQIRSWIDRGCPVVPIACNFSRIDFLDENMAETLKGIAGQYQVPPSYLEIEITESALMDDMEAIIAQLRRLREVGFTVAIDDFGTGYSSLGILQDLPADVLKIDRSFLQRDMTDAQNLMLIRGIINIAKILDLKTVCEGVETADQSDILKRVACDMAQGYYYSKPVPAETFEGMLRGSVA